MKDPALDPTPASIAAQNTELAQLRNENTRLARALIEADLKIKALKTDRDRLAAARCIANPISARSEVWWPGLIAHLNALRKKLDAKPQEMKRGYIAHPGSILNAYREGDLSFDEACSILGSAEFHNAR